VRVVVADTGPLHYLVLIGHIDILPRLFGGVSVPSIVRDELNQPETPAAVRAWITAPPPWLSVMAMPAADDGDLAALDDGERAAIVLAARLRAELILMDDRAGVAAARARGFAVTGTLGLLDRAARRGLIDLAAAFAALRATSFHCKAELLEALLAEQRTTNPCE
jgi:predicted nucleic acid-binding protein